MAERTCDICGAAVVWTDDMIDFDFRLRLSGLCNGLGAMCDDCGDREALRELAAMEREADNG